MMKNAFAKLNKKTGYIFNKMKFSNSSIVFLLSNQYNEG